MNCEQFQSQLDAYHDGELDAARATQLESHLRDCAACARVLRSLQSMSRLLQMTPMAEISADAMTRLHAQIERTMDRSLLPLARSLVGIAAAILVVATAGLLWMQPAHASAPQPWEGAMLLPQNADATAAANGSVMETDLPDLIVADLSRPDLSGSNRP